MANLLFDYDGTLHQCHKIYISAFRETDAWLTGMGALPSVSRSDADINAWLGCTAGEMWASYAPGLDPGLQKEGSSRIGSSMLKAIKEGKAELYPGALNVLRELKEMGHKLFLLSNCSAVYLETHRSFFGLDSFFTRIVPAEEYGWEPKQVITARLMEEHPGQWAVIGDRRHDKAIAENHSLPFIACLYGYAPEGELDRATRTINALTELPEAVSSIFPEQN